MYEIVSGEVNFAKRPLSNEFPYSVVPDALELL